VTLVHWDDVEGFSIPAGSAPLGGRWQRLVDAAGSVRVRMQRVRLEDGELLTPPHVHTAEEEITYVLSGTATLWQDGKTCTISAGDTLVFTARDPVHTLIGGAGGCEDVFGTQLMPETGMPGRPSLMTSATTRARTRSFWRGFGLIARLEPLDYFDGEPA
jgi:mannose-6-phosphate isomerase-like protein (cupin superfamily)